MIAVDSLDLPAKLLACIGFGAGWFHGSSHARALEATMEISGRGGFIGLFSVLEEMPEAALYREACEYVFARMPGNGSIVNTSSLSALDGHFGDWHGSKRTMNDKLRISPPHVGQLVLPPRHGDGADALPQGQAGRGIQSHGIDQGHP